MPITGAETRMSSQETLLRTQAFYKIRSLIFCRDTSELSWLYGMRYTCQIGGDSCRAGSTTVNHLTKRLIKANGSDIWLH